VIVQGPSGSGKTTLLFSASGLLQPDKGEVFLDKQSLYHLSATRRQGYLASEIGFVFQEFYLIPYLSVLENSLLPSVICPSLEAKDRARELLFKLHLDHRINHLPGQLSAGEQQRVAMVRALLNRPKYIFADEPTGNLDKESAKAIVDCLSQFTHDGGTVILVTHDMEFLSCADQVMKLDSGEVVK
jgi:putative ABC transport system ATP-binding protein